jgi:hypothetical protein
VRRKHGNDEHEHSDRGNDGAEKAHINNFKIQASNIGSKSIQRIMPTRIIFYKNEVRNVCYRRVEYPLCIVYTITDIGCLFVM